MVVLVSKGGKYSQRYLHSNNGLVLCNTKPSVDKELRHTYNVRVVGVCQVINRNIPFAQGPELGFNAKAAILRQYLSVVLAEENGIFSWDHREFFRTDRALLSSDGVHCNAQGQYCLYRSYRGAILKALKLL